MPPAKAAKRSRKQQLKDLQEQKKKKKESDDLYIPPPADEVEDDGDAPELDVLMEEAGAACERRDAAYRQRRSRERLKGLIPQAKFMSGWLSTPSAVTQAQQDEAMAAECGAECAGAIVETAIAMVEEEARIQQHRLKAAEERERYARKQAVKSVTPQPRAVMPRLSRSFSDAQPRRKRRHTGALADSERKLKPRRRLTEALVASIIRIGTCRTFKRTDVVDGDSIARIEWQHARRDYKELVKIHAMRIYLKQRKLGVPSRAAYEEAAFVATTPNGGHVNWQTVRIWLGAFISNGGKVRFDQRGRKPKTASYLNDEAIKTQALEWLREQLRQMRAKNVGAPNLTVHSFWKWCNGTLLKPLLDATRSLNPIGHSTARAWLLELGFKYKGHAKSIYYDGHERADVIQDRAEKLVMMAVLEEVTVTFSGKNCEVVNWPLLHSGERAVVWVSQDECSYHSNDDVKSEWAEEGKGLQIKQKSRGSLLMVSAFISELKGILRCSPAQRDSYIADHPQSYMAARLAADPTWNGSSTLIIEPGAAAGKDKYFDAEQLMEQTKLAMEIFEATHVSPGRWVFHKEKHGYASPATYPLAYPAEWLEPMPCQAMFFYDHSSGHGAYRSDALLASNANKHPDWNGRMGWMRDGYFDDKEKVRHRQSMQFKQGDRLVCDVLCPPGLDPHAEPTAAAAAATGTAPQDAGQPPPQPPSQPPSASEVEAAFKLFYTGAVQTLKKKNVGKSSTEVLALGRAKWASLPATKHQVYVDRVRAKATAADNPASNRIVAAGNPVPRALWGRHKGNKIILSERGLYPEAGLKGACQSASAHSATNDCCCAQTLSVQLDFGAECSALQHLVEQRIDLPTRAGNCMTTKRHICFFLPKFHCELNWIERLWGASKDFVRKNCLYTLNGLRETVPLSLSQELSDVPQHFADREDMPVAPILLQRRWARISRQYMAEYRKGADGGEAILAVKAQRSKRHRDVNDSRSRRHEAAMDAMASGGM